MSTPSPTITTTDTLPPAPAADTAARIAWPRLRATEWVGVGILVVVAAFILIVPLLPGSDPHGQDLSASFIRPFTDPSHLLGTDMLGRDLASRLAVGGQVSLGIVLFVVAINAFIGMVTGMIAGYAGGRLDNLLMGWADVQLAMPIILVLIALSAALGPNVWLMILTLAATYWVGYARVARSTAMSLKGRDFVIAPRIQGASPQWIVSTHIAPHVGVQVLILASADIGGVLLLTSSFDYLGLGVQAPTPSWGLLISEGQKYVREAPYLALIPGIAIFLVVIGTNLLSQRFTAERELSALRRRKKARA
ncbi:ABC transporter permease [uncultured Microbacterium sp.]|uniref:ABC transporter permease n=1 Tax=uncultured Microbacterium sp. TaxID=191216 RepID=UPI0025D3E48E|nr:ABC transporter permease [uncultured Microbacterium sp.]